MKTLFRTLSVALTLTLGLVASTPALACGPYGMTPEMEVSMEVWASIGEDDYSAVETIDVDLRGDDEATATVHFVDDDNPLTLRFVKREGQWKMASLRA